MHFFKNNMKITSHHLMITSLVFRSNLRLIPLLLLFLGYSRGMPHVLRFGKNLVCLRHDIICSDVQSRELPVCLSSEMTFTGCKSRRIEAFVSHSCLALVWSLQSDLRSKESYLLMNTLQLYLVMFRGVTPFCRLFTGRITPPGMSRNFHEP